MVNKNEALEAVASKVEDDNDAIPVDETKSTGGAGTVCPRG